MNHRRILIGCLFLLLLFGLMIYYSLDHNNHDPDNQYILDHYKKFTTIKVKLGGVVKNVDKINHTLLIEVSQSKGNIILVSTTENVNTTQQGDIVEVYGVLTSKNSMTAEKLLISERWTYDLIFIRSLPAIPFALYLFFSTWRFNKDSRRFERRQKHA